MPAVHNFAVIGLAVCTATVIYVIAVAVYCAIERWNGKRIAAGLEREELAALAEKYSCYMSEEERGFLNSTHWD
jgi:hypothetical protein